LPDLVDNTIDFR